MARAGAFPIGHAALAVAAILAVGLALAPGALPWATAYPAAWVVPFDAWIGEGARWLTREAAIGPFLVKDLTRAVGAVVEAPVVLLQDLLVKGFAIGGVSVGPVSWLGVGALFTCLGLAARDSRLAAFAALTCAYAALLGLWDSAMMTLALVLVAVVYGVLAGVILGVLAFRTARFRAVVDPVLDFMQTVPVFGYLVPAILLSGYGPAAALLITLIYAVPPMARVTTNALQQTDPEIVDLGRMVGCSPGQVLRRVLLPSQRPRLMLGVNQVIMLTLNMVIIASMIGAAGLGYDVWQALKSLHIGKGAEAGIAITLLAILLDRLSQRFGALRPDHHGHARPFIHRHRWVLVGVGLALASTALGVVVPAVARFPADWTVTSGRFWDGVVDWINIHGYDAISVVRDSLFLYVLRPLKEGLLALPWLGVAGFVAVLGWALGGARLALLGGVLTAFIALAGQWEKAMISLYLVAVAALLASLVGVPLGFITARHPRLRRIAEPVVDTLQTLPSFVYLIPTVMLFSVGDFSALVAVVLYAVAPAIRYTDAAVRQVPAAAIEAARAFGATRAQLDCRVVLPLALPDIVLGLNQTLMLAISMLVITALVGTRDLGQETLIALSKSDPGQGLVAGVCVAFIAIVADRLLRAWIARRRARLGLEP
ncbi:MAG: ABC transporter permease subunit [Alphaproteobacteria bacterium]|nr:ABC transporter permease subunit [Alphaproteobacteria bacterium]